MDERSSYEKINYGLRPAKAVERRMFCEAWNRLSYLQDIKDYRYVGFGSPYFSDFSIIHKNLGLEKLISIEKNAEDSDRFNFNRPFSCIETIFEHSNDALPVLDWSTPTILWLDYDYKLNRESLQDINTFFTKALPGSMFIISINIKPDEPRHKVMETKEKKVWRIQQLIKRVGREKLSSEALNRNLGLKLNIQTIHEIVQDQIDEVLLDRNGLVDDKNKQIKYEQILNLLYADGVPMLTIGGIIFARDQADQIRKAKFEELSFTRSGIEPFEIEIPNLTFREIKALDELLPSEIDFENGEVIEAAREKSKLPRLSPEDIKKYAKVYRYFPTFAEANF